MRSLHYYLCIAVFVFASLTAFGGSERERDTESPDNSIVIDRIVNDDIEVIIPSVIFSFTETMIKLKFKNPEHTKLLLNNNKLNFIVNGEDVELSFKNGETSFNHKFADDNSLSIYVEEFSYTKEINAFPLWALLLPAGLLLIWIIRKSMNKRPKRTYKI